MRKTLLASANLLAFALPIAANALPAHARAPDVILVAGEGMGLDFQTQLQTAKRAIAAHDMKTAMQALDRAEAMAHGKSAMTPIATRISATKKMLTAGDIAGADHEIDTLLTDPMVIGNGG